jgi:N-acylneuraminate cytidylyltransferase
MPQKIVSLITARGGSKGVPGKNIIDVEGFPLIHYAIEVSKKSNVDEIWVTTDDKNIKEVSLKCGAQVIDRPSEFAQDDSPSEQALLHFAFNVDFDIMVFIQPTSPFILSSDINKGIEMINEYDSVFSAYKEHWSARWTLSAEPTYDIYHRPMRQHVEEKYVENGAFYVISKENLLRYQLRYGGKIGVVEMPNDRSFQIDTPEDLDLVRKIMKIAGLEKEKK